ncbi:uncharacterized protein LOC118584692 [Onychomys torridus]|uniref:uncharacterized protein LOC118584692 n=1 Tax=Onychomys torridus TaxID=38674 RepID=UPI00167FD4E3|nr:uncharacterized protein LOC118584692 [Onychomys torridus]
MIQQENAGARVKGAYEVGEGECEVGGGECEVGEGECEVGEGECEVGEGEGEAASAKSSTGDSSRKTGNREYTAQPADSSTTQKSHETQSSALISLSLLLGEDPGHLSRQPQATSSQEPLGCPRPSEVGSEYPPFFHIHEQPLAMEELAQQVELCPGHKAGWSSRKGLFLGESAPPSGFFPYYRSQEELLPSTTPQGCQCLGTRDHFPGSGAQDGCCKVTWDGFPCALAGPDLLASGFSSSPACCHFLGGFTPDGDQGLPFSGDRVFDASGFVPYYRSPEEELHTSPVPPSSVLGSSRE